MKEIVENENKELNFNSGISIIVPNANFESFGIGKIDFTEELSDSTTSYGKAIILPEEFNFKDTKNLGKVQFAEDILVTKLDIWCYYKNNIVNGRGTVLYPVYFPKCSQHLGVRWSIFKGSEFINLKTFGIYPEINEICSQQDAHDISQCCYVEILPNAKNSEVIIQCSCTDAKNNYLHKFIKLFVTYDIAQKTKECAIIDIENNNGNSIDRVSDTKLELKVKFYPPNTEYRDYYYRISNDFQITEGMDENDVERNLKKQNIINDLISTFSITKKDDYDLISYDMPRFWQKDILLNIDLLYYNNTYIKHGYKYNVLFPIEFKLNKYLQLDLPMKNTLGYIDISSTNFMCYCELSHDVTAGITNQYITRKYFNNPAIGPKIITTGIYTPLKLVTDAYGEEYTVLDIEYIISNIIDEQIFEYPEDSSIWLYGKVIYNTDTSKLYIIYNDIIYDYSEKYLQIDENTIAYCNGELYRIQKNEDTYTLVNLNKDTYRIHRYNYDIGYLSPNNDIANTDIFNVFRTNNEIFHSTTLLKNLSNDFFNIISKQANLLGYDWSIINYTINNNSNLIKCPLQTFGNYINGYSIGNNTKEYENILNNESGTIYINYSGAYGEYKDLKKYSNNVRLKNALENKCIEANMNYGKMYNLIIYTLSEPFTKYTAKCDYPKSLDDLINMRNVAEIDLQLNYIGQIVNAGWGNQPVLSAK